MHSKKFFIFSFFSFMFIFLLKEVSAHCPLCVIGAGAAAAGAAYIGINPLIIGLFIGAFAMSMGMWFSGWKYFQKKYIPFQKGVIIIGIFLLTLLPILPVIAVQAKGFYLSLFGNYGTLFNRTYTYNPSLLSGLFGGLIVFISPPLSAKITNFRKGKMIPFQGIFLTFAILIIFALIIQFSFANLQTSKTTSEIILLSPAEFEKIIQNESVFLLNTHTPYVGEINGTDLILEDWENVKGAMNKLPADLSQPIAVYCNSGRMSGEAVKQLKKMGYEKIYDLDGGMIAWENSGRKIIN